MNICGLYKPRVVHWLIVFLTLAVPLQSIQSQNENLPAYISPRHKGILQRWLLQRPDLRLATDAQGPGRSKVKKPVTVKVPVELAEEILRDDELLRQAMSKVPGANAAILAEHLVAELIDLNFDGRPEYLVRDDCSAGEYDKWWCNCEMRQCFGGWVYRRTRVGFEMLLNQGSASLITSTNGYRDLGSEVVLGCCSVGETIFKFDGRRYVVASSREIKIP